VTIFVTEMRYQKSPKSGNAYRNHIKKWGMISSITISLLFIILLDALDVAAQIGVPADDEFLSNFVELTNKSGALTNSYQQEIGKWGNNQYSNTTMMMITNDTVAQINDLIDETSNLQIPEKFKDGVSLYTKSLEAERDSYKQFGEFIKTGDRALNETSTDLLTDSLKYEIEAFQAIQAPPE
jgi:hypothetical protein